MLDLFLAIASSALVSVAMRLSQSRVKNGTALLVVNYATCLLLSWAESGFLSWVPSEPGLGLALGVGAVNGLLYLAGFFLLQVNIRKNGVVLSSIFMKLGLLVSMASSVLLFGERPGLLQWLGFLLAVAAIVLINYLPGQQKAGSKWGLLIILLSCGAADTMSKVFETYGNPALSAHFLLYTFLSALLGSAVLCLRERQGFGVKELAYGLLVGVPNYFSAKFLLWALKGLSGVIVYPVSSVGTILVVTLTGVLVFKEKLTKRQSAALTMILAALVLLNL